MSSDDYYDTDPDEAVLGELDAIEAAQASSSTCHNKRPAITKEDSFFDDSFNFDERELENLDKVIEEAYQSQPVHRPVPPKVSSRGSLQTTLFGDVIPAETSNKSRTFNRTTSKNQSKPPQETKKWDHTEFAKSGWKKPKAKAKARVDDAEEDIEDEAPEFEQFPAPFISVGPPPPMKLKPDLLEAKHWIYPLNQPKRDYQFNIVKHALFDNTIVALPTGLGKTFVAGVIMLNFYRWFPEGKVVFVAPTKPLVAQQIEACHRTCGIPGSDAAEMTGQVPKGTRNRLWKSKRVFYMTPQTLMNDLVSENCDVQDIILLVVDEAHRASGGDYAYNQVVRYMMAKNPHFRVLALTATPGSTPDAVQNLVDGLHISRIEIRDENSLDLKQYIHEKEVKQHIIAMSGDVISIREHILKVMDHFAKSLMASGIIHHVNLQRVHPYFFQHKAQELKQPQKWAYSPLHRLSTLARVLGYLVEGTIGMCYTAMQKLMTEASEEQGEKQKTSKATAIIKLPSFMDAMQELEKQKQRGFANHPKMEKMLRLIIDYFGQKLPEPGADQQPEQSKAMVFVTHREAVDEIVAAMDAHRPLLRASKFIGQGTDVRGQKGQAQKEQLEVIRKFKADEFNVLVATSIGEEGLDIGEVDLIICYDAQKTPIRMLQRMGRTGRKRAGIVHVLLSEGREEQNLEKAKATYKEVQKSIVRGDQVVFYDDVERLLPEHIRPQCVEKQMETQEYVREPTGRSKSAGTGTTGVKRKRNDDIGRNMPPGASTGFVSVAELVQKGKSKKQKPNVSRPTLRDFNDAAGEDDDTDRELESGLLAPPPTSRLLKSTSTAASSSIKGKPKLRKSKTMPAEGPKKASKSRKKKEDLDVLTSSQFESRGMDDSDDMDIERGLDLPKSSPPSSKDSVRAGSSERAAVDGGVIDINTTDDDEPLAQSSKPKSTPKGSLRKTRPTQVINLSDSESGESIDRNPKQSTNVDIPSSSMRPNQADDSIAWLVENDDDDEVSFQIIDSSPVAGKSKKRAYKSPSPGRESSPFAAADEAFYQDDDLLSPVKGKGKAKASFSWDGDGPPPPSQLAMPPPAIPSRFVSASSLLAFDSPPEASFAIRPAGKAKKAAVVIGDSPVAESPLVQKRRIRKRTMDETGSPVRQTKKARKPAISAKDNPWYDFEATHSGDDISVGSSGDDEADPESESDRQFLEELPETQVSPSYNQTQIYRNSLLTQAPNGASGPAFATKPLRRAPFGRGTMSNKRRQGVSSSPPREGDEDPDEYEFGSFVVHDEADISYEA